MFYRQTTVKQALSLDLRGWVRNDADGAVSGEASGSDDAIGRLYVMHV